MGSTSAISAATFKQVNQGGKTVGKETFGVGPLLGIAMLAGAVPADVRAQQNPIQQVAAPATDNDDIGGVVTSRFGPEAGVWVIAETTGFGTRFAKMAVTDERGRYVIPDLPTANYRVWVRGYGLVDSPKVASEPGKILNLTAVTAPSLAEAAQYYPAAYWYSMVKIPDQSRFPGTGDKGNGIPEAFKTQDQWLRQLPPDRQLRDTVPVAKTRQVRVVGRRVVASAVGWAGGTRHGELYHAADDAVWRPAEGARRLDRPHPGRRTADPQSAASRRRRAQPRHHRARLARL